MSSQTEQELIDTPYQEDAGYQYEEVFQLGKTDMDFFAGLALPDVYKYPFPDLYLQFWALLTSIFYKARDFSQIALGLPRGFAKTLVIKLLILYAILYTPKKFILVLCENEEKGKSILADVADMLSEPNIKAVFGNWEETSETDTLTKKKFKFRGKSVILKCAGAGTGIRGISEKFARPDLIIFDDIQSREGSESEILSKNLETWMTGTAMKAKSPEGCTFLFVANMYPTKGSLLRKLKGYSNWIKFIVGGILSDGTSLWEELQPLEQLLKEFKNDLESGQPQIFYSEVLNDETASVNTAFDITAIPPYPYTDNEISTGAYVIVDPATDKVNADYVAIGGFTVLDGRPVLRKLKEDNLSPGDTVREAIKMCLSIGASLLVIESTAYQYSLKYWCEQIFMQLGIAGIQVIDIYPGQTSKNSRILSMFKQLVPSASDNLSAIPDLVIHPEVKAQVTSCITQFNPLKRDNTDNILDLLTYAPRVLAEFGNLIAINEHITDGQIEDIPPEYESSPF